jgi:glutathione S-transferase
MKLFNSFGPNPRLVRMFIAEKGLDIPAVEIDLRGAENRQAPYLSKNPAGQIPALELSDGSVLAETIAICEYFEELHPTLVLIGASAIERANTRMWVRRVELNITEHMYNGFRYAEGIEIFRNRVVCIPEAATGIKAKAKAGLAWLNKLIADRNYIAGDKFSLADIALYCCIDFCKNVGQPLDPELENISTWFARINARPSAKASLHGSAEKRKLAG